MRHPSTWAKRYLAHHPIARGGLEEFEDMLSQLPVVNLERGELLCREGDPVNSCFFIESGTVTVTTLDITGKKQVLGQLQAPALLGHMALLSGKPRSATVVVDREAEVFVMTKQHYAAVKARGGRLASTLRRTFLASLSMQLHTGNAELRRLLATNKQPPTTEDVARISGSLKGYRRTAD